MKKNFIVGFIWILILGIAYCGYKIFLLSDYKATDNIKLRSELSNIETISITKNPNIDYNNRVKFRNLIYTSIGSNFKFDEETFSNNGEENYYTYYYNDVDLNTYNAIFKIGITYSLHDILVADKLEKYNFNFKGVDRRKLLQKYNLNTDYDIFKYIVSNYNSDMNVLASSDKIKLNYAVKTFANVMIPSTKITLIDGDYQGYIYTTDGGLAYEVHLIHNEDNYFIKFTNGPISTYFTMDNVKDFISNINFISR